MSTTSTGCTPALLLYLLAGQPAWQAQQLANLRWQPGRPDVARSVARSTACLSCQLPTASLNALEPTIELWLLLTLFAREESAPAAGGTGRAWRCTGSGMPEPSNAWWLSPACSPHDGPVPGGAVALCRGVPPAASPQTCLGNPSALIWALWRLRSPQLEHCLFNSFKDLGVVVELVASGLVLMGNEWARMRPIEVRLEEALQAVCFWY